MLGERGAFASGQCNMCIHYRTRLGENGMWCGKHGASISWWQTCDDFEFVLDFPYTEQKKTQTGWDGR
jgi:hypothetical protein